MKKIALLVAAIGTLIGCTSQKKAEEPAKTKSLVLYYSQNGTTKTVAENIQKLTGADIAAVNAVEAYDGDFQQTIARCQQEKAEGKLPEIQPLAVNVAEYDTIYLGYPIWFGTYAPPIETLVKANDFAGKVLVPFCTFGSGGLNTSTADLKAVLTKATILNGYGVRTARVAAAPAEVETFLKENKMIAGEVAELPAFGEQHEVSAEEAESFHKACDGYQFPLGTPVTCASRERAAGVTDYLFVAESDGPQGKSQVQIKVIVDANNGTSEFTEVIR